MQGVSESLAGRAGVLELPTLSADEVLGAQPGVDLREYIVTGGFPILHAGGPEQPGSWYPSYVATYLERDVRNVLNVSSLRTSPDSSVSSQRAPPPSYPIRISRGTWGFRRTPRKPGSLCFRHPDSCICSSRTSET